MFFDLSVSAPFAFPAVNRFCMAVSCGRGGSSAAPPRRCPARAVLATHQRLIGQPQASCKQNYVRLMCKYASFGHALFTVRLSDGPMVPGARTLIGVHHAGVTVFDKRKVPSVVHTYNEVVGWQHDRTRVLISLEEEDGTAAQLYLQALPEVRRELTLPLSGSLAFS